MIDSNGLCVQPQVQTRVQSIFNNVNKEEKTAACTNAQGAGSFNKPVMFSLWGLDCLVSVINTLLHVGFAMCCGWLLWSEVFQCIISFTAESTLQASIDRKNQFPWQMMGNLLTVRVLVTIELSVITLRWSCFVLRLQGAACARECSPSSSKRPRRQKENTYVCMMKLCPARCVKPPPGPPPSLSDVCRLDEMCRPRGCLAGYRGSLRVYSLSASHKWDPSVTFAPSVLNWQHNNRWLFSQRP